jgi:hypothetical protein
VKISDLSEKVQEVFEQSQTQRAQEQVEGDERAELSALTDPLKTRLATVHRQLAAVITAAPHLYYPKGKSALIEVATVERPDRSTGHIGACVTAHVLTEMNHRQGKGHYYTNPYDTVAAGRSGYVLVEPLMVSRYSISFIDVLGTDREAAAAVYSEGVDRIGTEPTTGKTVWGFSVGCELTPEEELFNERLSEYTDSAEDAQKWLDFYGPELTQAEETTGLLAAAIPGLKS